MDNIEQLTERINAEFEAGKIALPALPEIALRVRKAVNAEDTSFKDIAKLIQIDQSITARVIQIANSPLYQTEKKINDCHTAISRLGLKSTREIVVCLVMHNMFMTTNTRIRQRLEEIWKQSSYVASISSVLARSIPGLNPDEAMLAGLVHSIGKLPILHYIEDYLDISNDPKRIDAVLDNLQCSIGRKILEKWGFDECIKDVPEQSCDFYRQGKEQADYADVVIVAKIHSMFGTKEGQSLPQLTDLPAFKKMGLSNESPQASLLVLQEASDDVNAVLSTLNS